ncbi:MAG TPA: LLM class flavin-dependent oxidoreductase [Abditibacterium sp.]|jgi:luciferase family oxidoreductase group 1
MSTLSARLPFSLLDLVPITQGSDAGQALKNSLDLARHAETWGYNRFWVAEHHNMPGIAGAATAVVLGHIAGGTSQIRVGSGGIMLPNHAPLVIAEQFGTLESLFPGRIDLGLGRAPGTDQITARALRRDGNRADSFPQDVVELQNYLAPATPNQRVRAVPGAGTQVPIWLLGSSVYSASLAGTLGLPFAFASHFAPDLLLQALSIYRAHFEPSDFLEKPYAMVAVNVFAADSDAEARRLFTSVEQSFVNLRRGAPGQLPPPLEDPENRPWADFEQQNIDHALAFSYVGTPETIQSGLQTILDQTGADELIITGMIYDHAARLRSFELAAQVLKQLRPARELALAL